MFQLETRSPSTDKTRLYRALADDLRARGGQLEPGLIAAQLGAPVALISAAKGEGLERVWSFLDDV